MHGLLCVGGPFLLIYSVGTGIQCTGYRGYRGERGAVRPGRRGGCLRQAAGGRAAAVPLLGWLFGGGEHPCQCKKK